MIHSYNVFFTVPAPHIIVHPTNTSAAAPFSAVFTCSAEGYGDLNIRWRRKGVLFEKIPEKSKINQENHLNIATSKLVIPNVTDNDVGMYYCIVWANRTATSSFIANLKKSSML